MIEVRSAMKKEAKISGNKIKNTLCIELKVGQFVIMMPGY